MIFLEFTSIYVFGGIAYGSLEMFWRGHTHWSMILTGGLCCCLMHLISTRMKDPVWKKWIMCAAVVTAAEFVVGCVVNLSMGWEVWDYSNRAMNLMGQICPLFSFFWLALSIPFVYVSGLLKKYVFVKQRS